MRRRSDKKEGGKLTLCFVLSYDAKLKRDYNKNLIIMMSSVSLLHEMESE